MWTSALFDCREINTFYGTSYSVEQLDQVSDMDIQEALTAARGVRKITDG